MRLTEHAEQALVVQQLRACGVLAFSVPNEGQRTARGAARFAQRGLLKGAPDLVVAEPPPGWQGPWTALALEFKSTKGKLRPEQEDVLRRLHGAGWLTAVVYGAQEALEHLRRLGYAVGRLGPTGCEAAGRTQQTARVATSVGPNPWPNTLHQPGAAAGGED